MNKVTSQYTEQLFIIGCWQAFTAKPGHFIRSVWEKYYIHNIIKYVNLPSVPLTKDQESLLEHWPNFAVTPQRPPYGEYIKAIETACQSLDTNSAEELRSDVYRVLRHPCLLRTNLRKEEFTAIKQLKADKERIILTTDKGIALVVKDRSDYIKKANELLQDSNTYKTIPSDPTNKLKN